MVWSGYMCLGVTTIQYGVPRNDNIKNEERGIKRTSKGQTKRKGILEVLEKEILG